MVLIKDGQAVFTNLEKLYLYRYAFLKGKPSDDKIEITKSKIEQITDKDVKNNLLKMMEDSKSESYKDNSLLQDKILWVAREYQKQGIYYAEISVTWIVRKGEEGARILEELHDILPKIEAETGVKLRFLGAFSRTLMTEEQLKEGLDAFKVAARSPYVVGSDIIGEEVNDIYKFKPVIKEIVEYAVEQNDGFTVKIHAGENDSLRSNVKRSIECILESVPKGKKMPRCRLGHGLYGIDTETDEGKKLIKTMKKNGVILEFQLTSNVRLNNLTEISLHPLKKYLANDVNCVQGSDGCGFYGTDCMEEQMALTNLLNLSSEDLMKMRAVEDKLMAEDESYFKLKERKFEEWLNGRNIKEAVLEEQTIEIEKNKDREFKIGKDTEIDSEEVLRNKIVKLPTDKFPVVIAGGSFNTLGRETEISAEGLKMLKELVQNLDNEKAYFVIGHKMQGYEKAILDISKELGKKFEIDAIIPKKIDKTLANELLENNLDGVCISTESEELGIYKSFNYEIFERRPSVVVAFDGNSPVSNLVQEAKNGKGKSKIYINDDVEALKEKASYLDGYITKFNINDDDLVSKIKQDNPDILS